MLLIPFILLLCLPPVILLLLIYFLKSPPPKPPNTPISTHSNYQHHSLPPNESTFLQILRLSIRSSLYTTQESPDYLSRQQANNFTNLTCSDNTFEWHIPDYGKIRFTHIAPLSFRYIRSILDICIKDILESLSSPFTPSLSQGKSQSTFYYTETGEFMLKTLRGSEGDNLSTFLPDYTLYLSHEFNSTLLPKYIGMFTLDRISAECAECGDTNGPVVDIPVGGKLTVVMMRNILLGETRECYDFKGTNVGRHAIPLDGALNVCSITMKELDYERRLAVGLTDYIRFVGNEKESFLQQLKSDVGLLQKHGFMDYSLLVGFGEKRQEDSPKSQHSSLGLLYTLTSLFQPHVQSTQTEMPSTLPEEEPLLSPPITLSQITSKHAKCNWRIGYPSVYTHTVYYIGLIDVLQKYTLFKRIERNLTRHNQSFSEKWKKLNEVGKEEKDRRRYTGIIGQWEQAEVSVEEPMRYGERLVRFVESICK